MLFGLDPMYWVFVGPAILLVVLAQILVKSSFSKYSRVAASSGVTGAQAAHAMLQQAGLAGEVGIERHEGFLSDHYDPRKKVLRLSPQVYEGRSLASLGVACHEAGHAVQHAKNYAPLTLRNAIVPLAGFGDSLGVLLIFAGLIIGMTGLAKVGVILFAAAVLFQIINLPVEFDASSRAKRELRQMALISGPAEQRGVSRVLNAAAMTYVAGALAALMQLLYFAMLLGGGDD